VCSGEIIDSFDTHPEGRSRQQDGILYRSDPEANRFLLPSGMRLIPIETVAAVIEVKLTLTKPEFESADLAATETARLRLRGSSLSYIPRAPGLSRTYTGLLPNERANGVSLDDPQLDFVRPTFAIFAFGGVSDVGTIASWLKTAKTISLVACLEAGCALRSRGTGHGTQLSFVSQGDDVLGRFGECIRGAISNHEELWKSFHPDFSRYATHEKPLRYWDETGGYEHPDWYQPEPEELAIRERLYENQPSLRPRK
jgi:hypothetical protein